MINLVTSSTPKPAKILIFDSGIGGLSILQEIHQQFPHCTLFYGSDNAAFPYGTKTETELIERVDAVLHQLQSLTQADIIIVACNTASTIVLPHIRERFSQAIIGVVPAIKPAAKISQSKHIGLLATEGTIKRRYTKQLITEFASDCQVVKIGSNQLVHLAENKLRGEVMDLRLLTSIIAPFAQYPAMDTIVLACTHFPLLKQELQQVLPSIRYWIDSGEAIARRAGYWLDSLSNTQNNTPNAEPTAYFTQQDPSLQSLSDTLQKMGIHQIKVIM